MKNFITEIFRNPPVLFTERLMLRKMERFDSEDMFEYASLPETTEYLLWSPHPDLNYTRKYLAFFRKKLLTNTKEYSIIQTDKKIN